MQRSRSEIVRSKVGVSSPNVGRDFKDNLELKCALNLWKVDTAGEWSIPGCGDVASGEDCIVGTAAGGERSALRLKANFFFGRDAERVSSKVCSNESICCEIKKSINGCHELYGKRTA